MFSNDPTYIPQCRMVRYNQRKNLFIFGLCSIRTVTLGLMNLFPYNAFGIAPILKPCGQVVKVALKGLTRGTKSLNSQRLAIDNGIFNMETHIKSVY